jgi:NDP-sugar pyrophosphorylase family protein
MKRVVVAAGEEMRTRLLTESRPKSMHPAGGRSLLERGLEVCVPGVDGFVIAVADAIKTGINASPNAGVTLGVDATTEAGEQVMRDRGTNL